MEENTIHSSFILFGYKKSQVYFKYVKNNIRICWKLEITRNEVKQKTLATQSNYEVAKLNNAMSS